MLFETSKNFPDFELIDTGDGYRLERWGNVILARPDPQIIWPKSEPDSEWKNIWAAFKSGTKDEKGQWKINKPIPNPWQINFKNAGFLLKLSPFKHTGLFPEQAVQWDWMTNKLQATHSTVSTRAQGGEQGRTTSSGQASYKLKVLNLFAYTGAATMVLAKAGCQVTHVDASRPAITWANENYKLNFGNQPPPLDYARDEHSQHVGNVRWILDDAAKFVQRELKRKAVYDGIVMDPPAFGHSPDGKMWKFNQNLPKLLADCVALLSKNSRFLIINGYATNSSSLALNNLLQDSIKNQGGKIDSGELCLKQKSGRMISTGIFARWSAS